jgi:D-sedoheptulose 7-phosphate isomerase
MSRLDDIVREFRESIDVKSQLLDRHVDTISKAAQSIESAFRTGNKLLICGNGGSAADAQHIAAELVGKYLFDRKPLPSIALTTNTSSITAIANDYAYAEVFERQVDAYGCRGDVLWAISTSGNSDNVVRALARAKELSLSTIGMTGDGGGRMRENCDSLIDVPSRSTPRIQEAHILVAHTICGLVEKALFGSESSQLLKSPISG